MWGAAHCCIIFIEVAIIALICEIWLLPRSIPSIFEIVASAFQSVLKSLSEVLIVGKNSPGREELSKAGCFRCVDMQNHQCDGRSCIIVETIALLMGCSSSSTDKVVSPPQAARRVRKKCSACWEPKQCGHTMWSELAEWGTFFTHEDARRRCLKLWITLLSKFQWREKKNPEIDENNFSYLWWARS